MKLTVSIAPNIQSYKRFLQIYVLNYSDLLIYVRSNAKMPLVGVWGSYGRNCEHSLPGLNYELIADSHFLRFRIKASITRYVLLVR